VAEKDAAGLIASYIRPMLEQELIRLQANCNRRKLDRDEMHKLLELARACVALRYVDIRVAEGEAKKGDGADLAGLTIDELLAKAQQLLKAQGLDASDLRKLNGLRAGGTHQ